MKSSNSSIHQSNERGDDFEYLYENNSPKYLGNLIIDRLFQTDPEVVKQLGSILGYEYNKKEYGGEDRFEALNDSMDRMYIKDHCIKIIGYYFLVKAKTEEKYQQYMNQGDSEKYVNIVIQYMNSLSPEQMQEVVKNMYKMTESHFERAKKNHNTLVSLQKSEQKDLIHILEIDESLHALPYQETILQKITDDGAFGASLAIETSSFSRVKMFEENTIKTYFSLFQQLPIIDRTVKNRMKIAQVLSKNIPLGTDIKYKKKVEYDSAHNKFQTVIQQERRLENYTYSFPQKVLYETYLDQDPHMIASILHKVFLMYQESIQATTKGEKIHIKEMPEEVIKKVQKHIEVMKEKYMQEEEMQQMFFLWQGILDDQEQEVIKEKDSYSIEQRTIGNTKLLSQPGSTSFVIEKRMGNIYIPMKRIQVYGADASLFEEQDTKNISFLKTYIKEVLKGHNHGKEIQESKIEETWVSLCVYGLLQIWNNRSIYGKSPEAIFLTLLNEFPRTYQQKEIKSDVPILKTKYIVAENEQIQKNIENKHIGGFFSDIDQNKIKEELNIDDIQDVIANPEEVLLFGGRNDQKTEIINKCIKDFSSLWKTAQILKDIDISKFRERQEEKKFLSMITVAKGRKRLVNIHYAMNFYGGLSSKKKDDLKENYEKEIEVLQQEKREFVNFLETIKKNIYQEKFNEDFFLNSIGDHDLYFGTFQQFQKKGNVLYQDKIDTYLEKMHSCLEGIKEFYFTKNKEIEKKEAEAEWDKKIKQAKEEVLKHKQSIPPQKEEALKEIQKGKSKLEKKENRFRKQNEIIFQAAKTEKDKRQQGREIYKKLNFTGCLKKLAEIEEKRAYTIQKILNHKEKIRRDIWWDIKKLQTKKRELSGKKTKGGMTEKDKKEMKKKQEKNKEAIENVSKKLKKLEIPIGRVRQEIKDISQSIKELTEQIQVGKMEMVQRFPKEYDQYLHNLIQEIIKEKEILISQEQDIKEEYKDEIEKLESLRLIVMTLENEKERVRRSYKKEIDSMKTKEGRIQSLLFLSTSKGLGNLEKEPQKEDKKNPQEEKDLSIKEEVIKITKSIVMRMLILYGIMNEKEDLTIRVSIKDLIEKDPQGAQHIIKKLAEGESFLLLLKKTMGKDKDLAKQFLQIRINSLSQPIEELVSDKIIQQKITINERDNIVYEKSPNTYYLLKIMQELGILDIVKEGMKMVSGEIPEEFKEWFGENKSLYEGVKKIIRKTSYLYYQRQKEEIEDTFLQKKYK